MQFARKMSVAVLAMSVLASGARAAMLSDLIAGNGTIVVGDKTFSDFGYFGTGQSPDASAITVDSVGSSPGGLLGLRFTGNFHDNTGDTIESDALINYTVTVNNPALLISDVYISGIMNTGPGLGYVYVRETYYQDPAEINIDSNGHQQLADSAHLTNPQRVLQVTKDIYMKADPVNGVAVVDYVEQTFGQVPVVGVPEPASLGLLALGAVALLRRRR